MLRRPAMTRLLLLSCAACTQLSPTGFDSPVIPARAFAIRAGRPVATNRRETHLRNLRQLTFGGGAAAHWSGDGRRLIWQSTRAPEQRTQLFVLDLVTGEQQMVSTGEGQATGGSFLQGDHQIVYTSTQLGETRLIVADTAGGDPTPLIDLPTGSSNAAPCPVTGRIAFTSLRDGNAEIYSVEPDGSDLRRLTDRAGGDSHPSYSPDGTLIVARAGVSSDDGHHEIAVIGRNGESFRTITDNHQANTTPVFHPDNRRILFSSNQDDPQGRELQIYMIGLDGSHQERVTFESAINSSPVFSPNGRFLAFASSRFGEAAGETNVFIAEWIE